MNRLDEQYQRLLQDIIEFGVDKSDRTGTGTKSIFGYTIHHNMQNGFPLLTTKKMPFKTIATELMWFLQGDTNIKYLVDNNCHIWDGDAYKNYEKTVKASIDRATADGTLKANPDDDYSYLSKESFIERIKTDFEFAEQWGELGPIYGSQWREWQAEVAIPTTLKIDDGDDIEQLYVKGTQYIDQIANLINDLKTNPDSRRLIVNAWNVGELHQMVLPPCHYGFQVYTRELNLDERIDIHNGYRDPLSRSSDYFHEHMDAYGIPRRAISLLWTQRSVDTFLGLPFNIASYGLLLTMLAKEVGMMPEHLIGQLGDVHLYKNHIEQAREQIDRDPKSLPQVKLSSGHNLRAALNNKPEEIDLNDFMLIGYDPHPTIKAPLSN